ncbi:MAG: hypothetical protein WB441_17115 [Nocardioidaceae bacterium]
MRTTLLTLAASVAAATILAGCSGDDTGTAAETTTPSSASTPTDSASASPPASPTASAPTDTPTAVSPSRPIGTTIAITVRGDTVDPSGERVKVDVGKPVTLTVDANRPGELHVHSTPEQELSFPRGTSTLTVTIDRPGIVEVEEHESDQVVVQLQVS